MPISLPSQFIRSQSARTRVRNGLGVKRNARTSKARPTTRTNTMRKRARPKSTNHTSPRSHCTANLRKTRANQRKRKPMTAIRRARRRTTKRRTIRPVRICSNCRCFVRDHLRDTSNCSLTSSPQSAVTDFATRIDSYLPANNKKYNTMDLASTSANAIALLELQRQNPIATRKAKVDGRAARMLAVAENVRHHFKVFRKPSKPVPRRRAPITEHARRAAFAVHSALAEEEILDNVIISMLSELRW